MRARISTEDLAEADEILARYARGHGNNTADHTSDDGAGIDEDARGATCSDGAEIPPLDADDLAFLARRLTAYADPDGAEPAEKLAMAKRGLTLGKPKGGLVPLTGKLVPDVASQLERLISAITNPRSSKAGANLDHDDSVSADAELPPPDERTGPQQRHDALAAILNLAARAADAPTLGGAAPTLVVTMSAEDFERQSGWAHLDGLDVQTSWHAAQRIACIGVIQRVIHVSTGRIIAIETTGRIFTAAQRKAITARDRECIIPGCHTRSVVRNPPRPGLGARRCDPHR